MLVPIRASGLSTTAASFSTLECDTMHGAECGGFPFVLSWGPPRPIHACHNLHCGCGIGVPLYVASWFAEVRERKCYTSFVEECKRQVSIHVKGGRVKHSFVGSM